MRECIRIFYVNKSSLHGLELPQGEDGKASLASLGPPIRRSRRPANVHASVPFVLDRIGILRSFTLVLALRPPGRVHRVVPGNNFGVVQANLSPRAKPMTPTPLCGPPKRKSTPGSEL